MINNARRWRQLLGLMVVLVAVVWGAAACGPTPETVIQELAATAVPAGTVDNPAATAAATAEPIAVAPSSETHNGLPVGFTDDGRPYIGNPNAPVVIREYSDYQCPFCARFKAQTLPTLLDGAVKNGDAVIIFYDFPLTSIHPQATAAANAARCAGLEGAAAYWAMHDALFDNMQRWSVPDPAGVFGDMAGEIGLGDLGAFRQCVDEQRFVSAVNADLQRGQGIGVQGTPSFEINGALLVGAQPASAFTAAIARAKAGQPAVEAPPTPDLEAIEPPTAIDFEDNYAASLGDPNAKVVIVEFTDYQCPFCARHSVQTFPALRSEFIETGRVLYRLKDLPLDQLHPAARQAAVAARCAGEQDAYWEMHDELFAQQTAWASAADPSAVFAGYAETLGLDVEAYRTCLTSGRFDAAIEASVQEAAALGVNGTPFYFVQGYPVISGAQPVQVFQQVLQLAENDELADAIVEARRRQLQQQAAAQEPPTPSGPVDVPIEGAPYIGDPNAPVVIVEYTDFQCPFCARHFSQTFGLIKQNYVDKGIVRYVFKDFPLDNIHPQAREAAQAARCAGDQDAYAAMHDLLFQRMDQWGGRSDATAVFTELARALALDVTAFGDCLSSGRHEAAVQADLEEGVRLGVRGTPAFFINGAFLNGAQPYEIFVQAIDAARNQR